MVSNFVTYSGHATVNASGAAQVIAAPSDTTSFLLLHSWTLSNDTAAQNAILYEYGTGSRILDRINGAGVSNRNLKQGLGAGSSLYLAVDGTAEVSATVSYETRV